MPAPVDELHVLALLTRVRQARVDRGEIKPERRYDIRAYKCVLAELAYLRRLHRRETGGTIVTSMPQLVKGLSRLHPAWKMDGDKFADRDRHHRAVRRRLRDLQQMGLLRWTAGVDIDGEEARTELQLLSAPDVDVAELADAGAQLARWKARYGSALNTGSTTGIRNAVRRGRPLSASERQRRGVARARARAQSRARASTTSCTPTSRLLLRRRTTLRAHLPTPMTSVISGQARATRTTGETRATHPPALTQAPRKKVRQLHH